MFKNMACIGIFTTQPGTAYAAGDAVAVGSGFQADQGFASACHHNLLVVFVDVRITLLHSSQGCDILLGVPYNRFSVFIRLKAVPSGTTQTPPSNTAQGEHR